MMKNELIELAKEKGFEQESFVSFKKGAYTREIHENFVNGLGYYLWLCELQKWLEENKNLFIIIVPKISKNILIGSATTELIYSLDIWELEGGKLHLMQEGCIVKERYLALEAGCYEALKLIE